MPRSLSLPVQVREALHRPHAALLPLRFLFGATFLYAGLNKLLDPAFLAVSGRTSITSQMAGWVHISPIGGLLQLALPWAVPIGLGIAVAEIGIGLGALLGLAFRLAALGGGLLSTLFLLTASWAVRPFYLGNDLPYALGWGTLLLAGSGGILALDDVVARRLTALAAAARQPTPVLTERRAVLRTALLGAIALSVASVATVVEGALGRRPVREPIDSPSPEPSQVAAASPSPVPVTPAPSLTPSPSPTPSPVPSPTATPGKLLAGIADMVTLHPVVFQDPCTSDPGVLLKLKDGRFVAYDAVCTHAACTVAFEPDSGYLVCPCHSAVFDPARDAKAIDGPTFQPLMAFPLVVDTLAGTIRLAAGE